MFRAIGVVIVLYALSSYFSSAFRALDDAATESLGVIEAAALLSQAQLRAIEVGD